MSSTNDEKPPLKKKKKKKKQSTEPNSIPSLPDELIVSCLARVSRLHYPLLSLASKRFGSHISSPELNRMRTLLNCTESCLYVCLQLPHNLDPSWFTLCKKPNQTLTEKKKEMKSSSGYVLAPIRTRNSPTVEWSNLAAVGSLLYAISKDFDDAALCTNLSYLDCRTHTWLEAPGMRIAHTSIEVDGRLYLPGSNDNQDSSSLSNIQVSQTCNYLLAAENLQVFNTETQTWNDLLAAENGFCKFVIMEGIMVRNREGMIVAFNIKEPRTFELIGVSSKTLELMGVRPRDVASLCMIDNITYGYSFLNGFTWSDIESGDWRQLKGLEGLPMFASYSKVSLVGYGGKMIVLWDKYVPKRDGYQEKIIWCAEITLEKRNNGKNVWGKVEWCDAVLTVPESYKFVYAVSATV